MKISSCIDGIIKNFPSLASIAVILFGGWLIWLPIEGSYYREYMDTLSTTGMVLIIAGMVTLTINRT